MSDPSTSRSKPVTRSDTERAEPASEPAAQVIHCDLCGNPMLDLHCKLVCERCGYKRDCSDP